MLTSPVSLSLVDAISLQTIVDYDRIMVLRDGLIVEFDKPSRLLRQRSSLFYGMVSEGGQQLIDQFCHLADRADDAREKAGKSQEVKQETEKLRGFVNSIKSAILEEEEGRRQVSSIEPMSVESTQKVTIV